MIRYLAWRLAVFSLAFIMVTTSGRTALLTTSQQNCMILDKLDKNSAAACSLLTLLLAILAVYAYLNPIYTWDVVPYVATTLAGQVSDPVELHAQTYARLADTVPAAAYDSLVAGPYASQMAREPLQFVSQLPMYLVKPGYVWTLRLLTGLGLEPVEAIMLVSLLPGILLVLLLFVWMQRYVNPWYALGAVCLFIPASRLVDISRVPVPDNYSALVLLLGLYGLATRKWQVLSYLLLLFAILVRINNIVFVALLFAWQAYDRYRKSGYRIDRSAALPVALLLASIAIYLAISAVNGHHWWRLFQHTLVAPVYDLEGFSVPFTPGVYLAVIGSGFRQLVASGGAVNTVLPVFLLIGMFASLFPAARRSTVGVYVLLFLPTLLVYFFLFPLVPSWDRFFTPFYGVLVVFACEVAALQRLATDSRTVPAPKTAD